MQSSHCRIWIIGWDAKRYYQRNMLVGLVTVTGAALICVAVLLTLDTPGRELPQPADHIESMRSGSNVASGSRQLGRVGGPSSMLSAQTASTLGWPTAGFVEHLVIVPEGSIAITPFRNNSGNTPAISDLSELCSLSGTTASSSNLSGVGDGEGGGDFGLPEQRPYMPFSPRPINFRGITAAGVIGDVAPNLPGLFQPTGYLDWPRLAKDSDTGYVVWSFVVDRKGRIDTDTWQLLEERPPGKGFAEAVRQYLIFGTVIRPQVIGGTRESMCLTVVTTCCKICTPSVEVVQGRIQAELQRRQ